MALLFVLNHSSAYTFVSPKSQKTAWAEDPLYQFYILKSFVFFLSVEGPTLWSAPSISTNVHRFMVLTQENVGTTMLWNSLFYLHRTEGSNLLLKNWLAFLRGASYGYKTSWLCLSSSNLRARKVIFSQHTFTFSL